MPHRNKTEGLGTIVSLLTSREFHFHFNLTKMQFDEALEAVNKKREGAKCKNSKAAIAARGSDDKKNLPQLPSIGTSTMVRTDKATGMVAMQVRN